MPPESPEQKDLDALVPGRASHAGTRRFAAKQDCEADHFACPDELSLSSIAIGTLRGQPGGVDDLLYRSVVGDFLEQSGNVFNTALSDRMQTSERALGHALRRAIAEDLAARDEIVVVTKGGQLTPDPAFATDPQRTQHDLYASYIDSGIIELSDATRGHSMAPRFLLNQIERSRRNLGFETIDYYLIQEPEIHLRALGADGFRSALSAAFEAMELAVSKGWIGAYGLSTWDGFLLPDSDRSHLSIVDLFEVALDVGSADHHFRALQLPYGLAMGEGAVLASQLGPDGDSRAILASLQDTGTAVFASAPLYGGRLVGHVPDFVTAAFPDTPSQATTALQFVRSTANVTSAVVGMREAAHVEDNMRLRHIPRANPDLPARLFSESHQQSAARA